MRVFSLKESVELSPESCSKQALSKMVDGLEHPYDICYVVTGGSAPYFQLFDLQSNSARSLALIDEEIEASMI
jgi:hypothetical protein